MEVVEVEDELELEVLVLVLDVWLLAVLEELAELEDELELGVLVEVEDELEPEMLVLEELLAEELLMEELPVEAVPVAEVLMEELPVEAVPVAEVLVVALPVAEVDKLELERLVVPDWLLAGLEELTPEAVPVPELEPEWWPVLDELGVKLAESDPCPVASEHGGGGIGDGQVVSVFLTTTVTTSLGGVVTVREKLPWWSASALAARPETRAVMAKSD